jgi:hypothetical protein
VNARLWMLVGAFLASGSKSEPLSIEPMVGVAAEYSSNPFLLIADQRSESDLAVLVNTPVRYDADAWHIALSPKVRYSDSGTYASLDSNSIHADASAQYLSDRGSFTTTSSFGRDSSLYSSGLSSNGIGVRADSRQDAVDWQRQISARVSFDLNVNWSEVNYGQVAKSSGLSDYRNTGAASSLSIAVAERTSLSATMSAGLYKTIDGETKSNSRNLLLGIDHQLTEIWSLSADAGYSKSDNSINVFFGPFFLGTEKSEQKGAVYKAVLTRKGELFNFTGSASRAYVPSGFAFLSRQDSAQLGVQYTFSERWKFGASGSYQRNQDPPSNGAFASRSFFQADISADWKWTPNWTASLHATRVNESYQTLGLTAASNRVALQISRQFLRINL